MKNLVLENEQLLSFLTTITLCGISLSMNSPLFFLISFIGGLSYHVIRGKKLGWTLPKEIKRRHSW